MFNLIQALNIFLKYGDTDSPFGCEHDVLYIYDYDIANMDAEDIAALEKFGFYWDDNLEVFYSYRYGSA